MSLDLDEKGDYGEEWWALKHDQKGPGTRSHRWLIFDTLPQAMLEMRNLQRRYEDVKFPHRWSLDLASQIDRSVDCIFMIYGSDYRNSRQHGQLP